MSKIAAVKNNLALLQITSGTLRSLAKARDIKNSAQYYEAFEIVSTLRIIQREIEKQAYALALLEQREPSPPAPLPEYPPAPEEVRKNPSTIKKSDLYQILHGPTET